MLQNRFLHIKFWRWPLMLAVLALCTLLPGAPEAQISKTSRAELSDNTPSVLLGPYLYVTRDTEKKLTYKAMVTRHQNNIRGERENRSIINLGFAPQPTWMVLSVTNNSSNEDWIVHFGQAFEGRYATAYKLLVQNQSTGKTFTRALREDGKPNAFGEELTGPALPIKLRKNQTDMLVFYIEAEGGLPATIAPRLMTTKRYIEVLRFGDISSILAGTFFISMMGFFIAIVYMKKQMSYLFFLLYYVVLTILFFSISNSFYAWLPFTGELLALLYAGSVIAGLFMARAFFDIGKENQTENTVIIATAVVLGLAATLNLFLFKEESFINQVIVFLPTMAGMLVIAGLSYREAQDGKYGGQYFALAWLMPFFGSLITVLGSLSALTPTMLVMDAYWLFLLPQAFLLVIGANKKIQMVEEEQRQQRIRESRDVRAKTRLRQSKESADQARLLRVIERERELMSELREREIQRTEEMRRAKEIADNANRSKSAFLAVVSHEIRTPMTGVMGMVRLLLDTKLSSQQNEYVLAVRKSGDTMMALLNDILDFEKSEEGKMNLENVDFDLPRMIQDVITLMRGRAEEKEIFLRSDIPDDVPRYIKGDPTRLRQVLLNLVTNAIKFTQEGGVTIRLRATKLLEESPAVKGDYEIYMAVEDTGIGIPEEVQENLFVPFSQADSSVSRKYGGTGLGLAICKRLIEAMGSSIRVSSQEDTGSTFFFTLLMEEGHAEGAAEAESYEFRVKSDTPPKRILVVEDNEMNRRVLQGLLQKYGHTVTLAQSGEQALEKCQEEELFDLILMDIQLPGMSGDETTRNLRILPNRKIAATPVIALTGNVMMDDIQRYFEANMNGHLAKPIEPEQLLKIISRVHHKNLQNPVILPEITPHEGAAPITQTPRKQQDGETPYPYDITETDLDIDSFEEAANTFETKIQTTATAKPQPANSSSDAFDEGMLERLLENLGREQFSELIGGFLQKADELVDQLKQAAREKDVSAMGARAHELKGMAANFGMREVSAIAAQAEKAAKTGQEEEAIKAISKLHAANENAKHALRAWLA